MRIGRNSPAHNLSPVHLQNTNHQAAVLPKKLVGHALDYRTGVLVAQVRVAFHHGERLMAQHGRDLGRRGAAHRQVAGSCMAQVVKAEILVPGAGLEPPRWSYPSEGFKSSAFNTLQ